MIDEDEKHNDQIFSSFCMLGIIQSGPFDSERHIRNLVSTYQASYNLEGSYPYILFGVKALQVQPGELGVLNSQVREIEDTVDGL